MPQNVFVVLLRVTAVPPTCPEYFQVMASALIGHDSLNTIFTVFQLSLRGSGLLWS